MLHDSALALPNSRFLVGLAWAKSGEEEVRTYTEHNLRGSPDPDRRLRIALRRTRRGVQNILRVIERDNLREVGLPDGSLEILDLIVRLCEAIHGMLAEANPTLAEDTRIELQELADAVADLEDYVEDERLAAEVPALYAQVAARATELYGSETDPNG